MQTRAAFVIVGLLIVASSPAQAQQPALRVDNMAINQGQTFTVSGAVVDFDVVHVWAVPKTWPPTDPVFLGWAKTDRIDRALQRPTGGFELLVREAPLGTYPIIVYAHDPVTNTFPLAWMQTITVRPCVTMLAIVQWIVRPSSLGVSPFAYRYHEVCKPEPTPPQ